MLRKNFHMALQSSAEQTSWYNTLSGVADVTDTATKTRDYKGKTYYLYIIKGKFTKAFVDKLDTILSDTGGDWRITLLDTANGTIYTYGSLADYCEIDYNMSTSTSYSMTYDVSKVEA